MMWSNTLERRAYNYFMNVAIAKFTDKVGKERCGIRVYTEQWKGKPSARTSNTAERDDTDVPNCHHPSPWRAGMWGPDRPFFSKSFFGANLNWTSQRSLSLRQIARLWFCRTPLLFERNARAVCRFELWWQTLRWTCAIHAPLETCCWFKRLERHTYILPPSLSGSVTKIIFL